MKTTILALGLLFALTAQAEIPLTVTVYGTVTAVSEHSIEIDGKSYPIEVNSSASSELANVNRGDKVSIEFSAASSTTAATQPAGHPVSQGLQVVHSPTAKLGVAQVQRIKVTKAN